MVKRSGFYVRGNTIVQRVVNIDWDLGFDRDAKHEYIRRIFSALGETIDTACDVTTASILYHTRMLSPIFVKVKNQDISVEDYWEYLKETESPELFDIPGLFDYIYITNLSNTNIETAMKYTCYVDVFHNPSKGYHNTQARSLAVLRLLKETNSEYVLSSANDFLMWYRMVRFDLEEV